MVGGVVVGGVVVGGVVIGGGVEPEEQLVPAVLGVLIGEAANAGFGAVATVPNGRFEPKNSVTTVAPPVLHATPAPTSL